MKIKYSIRKTNKKEKIEFIVGLLFVVLLVYIAKVVF
ncbi:hypothetical protein CVM48_07400 [Staphylococcus pseudintermedius]|nr:hypothetical protein CVM48_07400 [Staphylococcus pseudintermedius]